MLSDLPLPPRGGIVRAPIASLRAAPTAPQSPPVANEPPPDEPPHLVRARLIHPTSVTSLYPAVPHPPPSQGRPNTRIRRRNKKRRGLRFFGPGFGSKNAAAPEPSAERLADPRSETRLRRREPEATLRDNEIRNGTEPTD